MPLENRVVRRTRHTPSQVGLSAAERRVNVQGAFTAQPSAAGRNFVLIDDVCTTGATLAACAAALVEAGAAAVWGVTLARARFGPADSRLRAGRAAAQ
jgi:predicted amidophosphoribosyltransferase